MLLQDDVKKNKPCACMFITVYMYCEKKPQVSNLWNSLDSL